jgi:lysophospholipid acyltransferase (LPLAT)-like uncharacterized protein
MKIKKKLLKNIIIQQILGFLAAFYILFVKKTSKITIMNHEIPSQYWNSNKPFILAFWHNQLMTISFAWSIKNKINILASGHSDGRFGAIIGNYFNLNNIPTSDKNKNISLRPIFQIIKSNNYLGITPDGPRGPKEKVSEGIIKIAKSTQTPIIPIGFWSSKNFFLNSWDSFLITLPFSKCNFTWGDALLIPKDLDEKEVIKYQEILEKKIKKCIIEAKKNCK